jgi:menaquinone-dependent protoporphyrinogen IX oxidase
MNQVLVAYATENGLTKEFAQAIADTLSKRGKVVDIRVVDEVDNLSQYSAVVVGSAVHNGRWLPEAANFVTRNQDILHQIPTAYFTVCDMVRHTNKCSQWTDITFHDNVYNCLTPNQLSWFSGKQECISFPCGSAYWQGTFCCRLQIFSMS